MNSSLFCSITNQIETHTSPAGSSQNKNKTSKSKRQKPFTCPHCPRECTEEKYLKRHMWSRHRTIKRKRRFQRTRKNVGKFRCGLCNICCTTYQVLKTHKYSAPHRFLLRRSLNTKFVKRERASEQFKSHCKKSTAECHKTETKCKNISQQVTSDENDKDSSHSKNLDSTDTNDSSEDSYSSSSHDENEEYQVIKSSQDDKYFYCRQDECKSKVKIFRRKPFLQEHKKLHKRGEYKCNFCAKVESTVIKLSLHECEMHSVIQSSSTNTKQNEEVYNCARCPFECKIEASYFKHFASVHLGIYNAKLGKNFFKCEICKKKLLNRNCIAKLHFTTHHDTNGLDPDSQIKRCDENECTAYFLSTTQLNLHKETQHFPSQHCVVEDDFEIDEVTEVDPLKCKFCQKIFSSLTFLLKHKRKFHSKRKTDTVLENKSEFSEKVRKYKRLVCPEQSCTKSFPTRIGLETHKKLHGTFPCNFCDHVDSFALDLALHEKEMHSSMLLNKRSAKPKFKSFKCSRCPKTFLYQNHYKTHFVNVHLNLHLTFGICSICKYAANSESELRTHIYRYHYTKDMDPSKIPKCDLCPAYFKIESQLIHHKTNAHNANESPLQCKECANVFRSEAGLKLHVLQTHKSKSNKEFQTMYNCVLDKCKRKFPNKQSLGRHQKLHGKGEFPCHFCDEICETVLKLISHETTNHLSKTTEKNMFSCSRCSYKNKFAGRFLRIILLKLIQKVSSQ